MKILSQLIKDKKFDWVNTDIEKNFTATEVAKDTKYKLFSFEENSSEDAIAEMKKDGWEPANISQLLSWSDWNDTDWVVALGSVAEVDGYRSVPFLFGTDSERELDLRWFGNDCWSSYCRFLAARNSQTLETSESGTLDTLTLRIEKLEKWQQKIINALDKE